MQLDVVLAAGYSVRKKWSFNLCAGDSSRSNVDSLKGLSLYLKGAAWVYLYPNFFTRIDSIIWTTRVVFT